MPRFSPRKCELEECSNIFVPTGPAARFCVDCAKRRAAEASRRSAYADKLRKGQIQKPGVGKGGNNAKGSEDSNYRNGIGYFMQVRKRILEDRMNCERCDKPLLGVSRYEWVVHHKDHDRTNNTDDNFELLCKRCHQIEHECHKAFEGAETIS